MQRQSKFFVFSILNFIHSDYIFSCNDGDGRVTRGTRQGGAIKYSECWALRGLPWSDVVGPPLSVGPNGPAWGLVNWATLAFPFYFILENIKETRTPVPTWTRSWRQLPSFGSRRWDFYGLARMGHTAGALSTAQTAPHHLVHKKPMQQKQEAHLVGIWKDIFGNTYTTFF